MFGIGVLDAQDRHEAGAEALQVHVLSNAGRLIAAPADPQGAAMLAGNPRPIDPVLVDQLKDQHGVEVQVGARAMPRISSISSGVHFFIAGR